MVKIEAIIRESKFETVKSSLDSIGVNSFTYWQVGAVSKEKQVVQTYRGVEIPPEELKRVFITIVANDEGLEPIVTQILKSAQTGQVGDGKIFIMNVSESYSIRTGLKGVETLKQFAKKAVEETVDKVKSFYDKFK